MFYDTRVCTCESNTNDTPFLICYDIGMALDWVAGNLFWTDKTYGQISMAKKEGLYPTVIIEGLGEPIGIAVHPERG